MFHALKNIRYFSYRMRSYAHNPRYNTRLSTVVTDAVVVSHSEWKRLKRDSIHLTAEQLAEMRRSQEETRRSALSQIQTKRSTFISPCVTPETITRTHTILGQTEERDYALKIAESKADEDLDEVKHVKSQMMAAEARAGRDDQLAEHAQMREDERADERQWADRLEANRREALQLYDDRDRTLREQRRAGRRVISAQIEEHKINAILEAERRDRESKALTAQNALVAEEDRKIAEERRARQAAFLHDCLAATDAMQARKRRDREIAKEEAQMVIEVAAQKALHEAAVEQEKADQKALKEREIAQIRKNQQRALDTQAKRDEMQAAKIQAEKDELAREKERADEEHHRKMVNDCREDRAMMIEAHKTRLLEEKDIEDAEVARLLDNNKRAREKARRDYQQKVAVNDAYRRELGQSAELEWQSKQPNRQKIAQERQTILDANDAYLARVNRIRNEKLEILRKRGIPERHLVDIKADRFELR
jgi:hypothetical protein